jgi:F-type H+-transporting ATPase subunit b
MRFRSAIGWMIVGFAMPARASDTHPSAGFADVLWPAVNLIILIATLAYFARKPVQSYFANRRIEIQGGLQSAADQLASAEAAYSKWQRRLIDLEGELVEIRATSRQRAEVERERILSDARAAAERIRRDAAAAVELELRRAREQLREEATQLAIELARERLEREMTDSDRDRLLNEFIDRVESTQLPDHRQRKAN